MWPKFGNSSITVSEVIITSILWGFDQKNQIFLRGFHRKNLLVFKVSWRRPQDMSWRRLQHVFRLTIFRLPRRPCKYVLKMSWRHLARCLEDVLKDEKLLRWGRLEDVLKTCLEDFSKTCLENVLKTSWKRLEDVWPRRIYWSWSRRLLKMKTKDVFKTSFSRRLHQGECLLG